MSVRQSERDGGGFAALWLATSVSHFGTMLGALGLTALLYLDASPAQMGLLAAAGSLPVLLFSLFAGVWVDRLPHKAVMVAADGRFVLLLSVPAAALVDALTMAQLYTVAFGAGCLTVMFDLAYRSVLPSLVPLQGLVDANSRLQMSESVAESVSPAAGGAIVQAAGGPAAVFVDALTFLASGVFVSRIRPAKADAVTEERRSLLIEALQGTRAVLGQPLLRAIFGMRATRSLFGGFFAALYSLWAVRELGLSPLAYGVLVGAGGAGSLVAAGFVGPITRRQGLGPSIVAAYWLASLTMLAIPLAGGPPWLAFGMLCFNQLAGDGLEIVQEVSTTSLAQSITPRQQLGRVNATFLLASHGTQPIGALAAGLLATSIGMRETLLVAVIGIMLGVLWLLLSPLPRLRSAEDAAPGPA